MMTSGSTIHGRDTLKTLFIQALALPPDRRTAFLSDACGSDSELFTDVTSLLETFSDASDYFERLTDSILSRPPRESDEWPEMPTDPYGLVGRSVAGYRILELLGAGGMGVVYRAHHEKLDRFAALKFLPPHLSTEPDAKARFISEARAASTLDHPNICTIYDVGETPAGQLFIAMACYDGETLKEKLIRGPLEIEASLRIAMQVARGLAKAHESGIVHRDVKPANVMVTRDGEVKLLDFGLAKVGGTTLTKTAAAMGTVAYMSPEQASGEAVDHRTDLWSLGVVLYEMVSGCRPFAGENERALLHAVRHESPPALRASDDLARIVARCLEKDRTRRYASAHEVWSELHRTRDQVGRALQPAARPAETERKRVFLCYDPLVESDGRLARSIAESLTPQADVFFDLAGDGPHWTGRLTDELAHSDVLVLLLSEGSIHSEMILALVEAAHERAVERRPLLLAVRVATSEPLDYPLRNYLSQSTEMYWDADEDVARLVDDVRRAISAGSSSSDGRTSRIGTVESRTRADRSEPAMLEPRAAAQPPRLEMPEGTMNPVSPFYVKRPEDDVALRAIAQQGVTITIKGPRQVGKSSLLIRTMDAARELGKDVVFLDFQLVDGAALRDAELFFRQFCVWMSDELDLEDRLDAYWKHPLSNAQRCTRYMERHILKAMRRPLVLAIDEVERVFDTDFRSDFFSMLRSWHNDRAIKPRWKGLDLALVTSTEPYQLIENLNQSPFNVGEVIALSEFTDEQVADLNVRHEAPLMKEELADLQSLLGGHPYLTRRALYLIASRRLTVGELLATATDDTGPFGDHLRYHLFRLHRQAALCDSMRRILRERRCDDEAIFWRLRGAGLVRRNGRDVVPRSRLYAAYFGKHLNG